MAIKKISVVQAKAARAKLKKLKSLGLFTGDLRKKPTARALKLISEFDAVLKGKAKVVQPKRPSDFKNIYKVKGKNVIVPRRKGERIRVNKEGEIVSTRKVGKRNVTGTLKRVPKGAKIKRPAPAKIANIQYAIPFNTRAGIRWQRFPSWDELQKFMAGYNYVGWQEYVVEEEVGAELTDEQLTRRAKRKLSPIRKKARKRKSAKKRVR